MFKSHRIRLPLTIALSIWLVAFVVWLVIPVRTVSESELAQFSELGRKYYHPDRDLPVYLIAGVIAVFGSAVFMRNHDLVETDLGLAEQTGAASEFKAKSPIQFWGWTDLAALAIIALLVIVIDPGKLTERAFVYDGFHHIDYYLMGPLQAFLHGKSLGIDVFAQYGGGWIFVYALIEQVCHVDYTVFFATFPIFGFFYYVVAYIALRLLTGDRWWSLVGLFAGIWLTFCCGSGEPRWINPSSTALRCPFDMLVAIAVLKLQTDRSWKWALIAGIAGGMSPLFAVDTGVYVLAGLFAVSGLIVLQCVACGKYRPLIDILWIWGACCASIAFGLTVISRGMVTDPRFLSGYFEAILTYGGGFSAIPLSVILHRTPLNALLFLGVLVTYTLALAKSMARSFAGKAQSRDFMRAFLATVGFGTLMIFVNRSDRHNLFHPILPACWLVVETIAHAWPLESGRDAIQRKFSVRLASLLSAGILVAVLLNRNVWNCPSAIGYAISLVRSSAPASRVIPQLTKDIREAGSLLQQQNPGAETVIIGEGQTFWLLTLGLPPAGRYCPAIPITKAQTNRIRSDLLKTGASSIIVSRVPNTRGHVGDTATMEKDLTADFEFQYETDLYAVYVRRPSMTAQATGNPSETDSTK